MNQVAICEDVIPHRHDSSTLVRSNLFTHLVRHFENNVVRISFELGSTRYPKLKQSHIPGYALFVYYNYRPTRVEL